MCQRRNARKFTCFELFDIPNPSTKIDRIDDENFVWPKKFYFVKKIFWAYSTSDDESISFVFEL